MSDMPVTGSNPSDRTACFSVHAPTDPSVMPRVLEVFTRRGVIPTVWHSVLCGSELEEIQIDIQVAGLAADMTDRLAQCLRQLVSVRCVLTSEKRRATAAA